MIQLLKKNQDQSIRVEATEKTMPLPPASLQSVLKKDLSVPAILVSNHERAFVNKYYNSEWDTFQSIDSADLSRHLGGVARTVSAAIYELATGRLLPAEITPNITLVLFKLRLK